MDKNYSLRESDRYNCLEGELYSPLFGRKIRFLAKGCDEVYALRCAQYFETVTESGLSVSKMNIRKKYLINKGD